MKTLTNKTRSKKSQGVRMVIKKKKVVTKPSSLLVAAKALDVALICKLRENSSWAMSAALYNAKSAVTELIQALTK